MDISFKDVGDLVHAIERARIKETISVEMIERRHAIELREVREEYELVIQKLTDFARGQREESDGKFKTLLKNWQNSLVSIQHWQNSYNELEKNFEILQKLTQGKDVDKLKRGY